MIKQLSDFQTVLTIDRNLTEYTTRFNDRVVSLTTDSTDGGVSVCVNSAEYDPNELGSWDATLLLDDYSDNLDGGFEIVNRFITMENLPTIHHSYVTL